MEFKKYQSLDKLGRQEVKGINEGTVYLFSKLDGCFPNSARVMLEDGTTKTMGVLVNQKSTEKVLCYNFETGELEAKKIVNWFKYPVDISKIKEEWVCISVDRNGTQLNSSANRNIKINVTTNHMIFVKQTDGSLVEKSAGNIEIGDIVLVPSENLTVIQEQVLLGGLLGDGSAFPNKEEGCYNGVTFMHSLKQQNYVEHKAKLLGEMCKSHSTKKCENSYSKEKYILTSKVDKRTQQIYDICYTKTKNSNI